MSERFRVVAESLRAGDLYWSGTRWTRIRSISVAERVVMLTCASGHSTTIARGTIVGVVRRKAAA